MLIHALACMIMQPPAPDPSALGVWRGIVAVGETDSRQTPQGVGVALREGALVLADGSVFEGELIGAEAPGGVATGEVVFNTVLSGYQEVITDPSYAGQIIAFTYPHIGNYGVSTADFESRRPFCRGVVIRELARRRSSWRSDGDLDDLLRRYGVSGIAGIDTRRLTRLIRETGALPGAFGDAGEAALRAAAAAAPAAAGIDQVAEVATTRPYLVGRGGRFRIVAYDLGIKRTILRQLATLGTVEVVPASTAAADVLAREPDGVFLSNGPGDPAEVPYVTDAVAGLLGQVPVFGICLGHQVMGRAIGAETVKLPFGHHGGNHPVQHLATGRVEITSQNHNFAVAADSLGDQAEVTHVNLNDGVCEGMRLRDVAACSVQYHPEAGPGPHDSRYLFEEFGWMMARARGERDLVMTAPTGHEPHGLPEPDAGAA